MLKLALCLNMWLILEEVILADEKNMYSWPGLFLFGKISIPISIKLLHLGLFKMLIS